MVHPVYLYPISDLTVYPISGYPINDLWCTYLQCYDFFLVAENLGDKVVDIIESALSPLDGRSEVMEMCLQSSTGEYKAIEIAATGDSEALGQWETGSAGQTMTASTGLRGDTYMTSAQGGGRGYPKGGRQY